VLRRTWIAAATALILVQPVFPHPGGFDVNHLIPNGLQGAAVGASSARDLRCELDDGRALALETVRRLGCEASLVGIVEGKEGEPLDIGRKTRAIPPALQRALKARDGGCRFPGCTHSRFTEGRSRARAVRA